MTQISVAIGDLIAGVILAGFIINATFIAGLWLGIGLGKDGR